MKQLNRIKVVLVEQNRTAKWLSEQIGKNTCYVDVRELIHVEKKNNSTNLQ